MALDFNNIKKASLEIILNDDKQTKLHLHTPSKKLLTELVELSKGLNDITEDNFNIEDVEQIYNLCSKVISRNRENISISCEKLENIFDMEDIVIFLQAYIEFTTSVQDSKNYPSRTIH